MSNTKWRPNGEHDWIYDLYPDHTLTISPGLGRWYTVTWNDYTTAKWQVTELESVLADSIVAAQPLAFRSFLDEIYKRKQALTVLENEILNLTTRESMI